VNLKIGGAFPPRSLDIFGLNILAAALHFAGDGQQRLELLRDSRVLGAFLHIKDKLLISI